jgi:hypothetical protein
VSVTIVDKGSNLVESDERNITAHLFQDGQARMLGGATTIRPVRGIALFTDLVVRASGFNYFIQFTALHLVTVMSPTFSVTIGPAYILRLLSAPNTSFGGVPFETSVVVYAEDEGGNSLNTGNATINLNQSSLGTDVSLIRFTGNRWAAVTQGVASFENLTLFTAGHYTLLVAIDDQQIFVPITVSPSFLFSLDFVNLSPTQLVGVSFSFCIRATDLGANNLIGVSVSVLFVHSFGVANMSLSNELTNIEGEACFGDVRLIVSGSVVIAAHAALSAISKNVSIYFKTAPLHSLDLLNPIAYASIGEVLQPAPLVVALRDVFGNQLLSYIGNVTIALVEFHASMLSKSTAVLSGNGASSVANGLAHFNVSINASGIYSLMFSVENVNMSSSKFTVVQDGITSLQIIRHPENSTGGLILSSQPIVVLFDKLARVHAGTFRLEVQLIRVNGKGVLSGNTSATYFNGSANFTDLTIDLVGLYQLQFLFGSFVAISPIFEILPGAASYISLVAQPTKYIASLDLFTVIVKITDFVGNVVPVTQGVNISSRTTKIIGNNFVFAVKGFASFIDIKIMKTGTVTLLFTSSNFSDTESDPFEIVSGSLKFIEYEERHDAVFCGIQWSHQPYLKLIDVGGNTFERSVNISLNVHSFTNSSVFDESKNIIYSETVHTNTGFARFLGVRSNYLGANILSFKSGGVLSVSNSFHVIVGPAHSVFLLQQPSSGIGGLPLATQPHLRVVDACNNSLLIPVIIQVEVQCESLNRSTLVSYGTYNVSEIHFESISLSFACPNSFLLFTCVACGLNGSNISSQSIFFDVRVGTLKYIQQSGKTQFKIAGGDTFALPTAILFDAGFNQLLQSGDQLNFSVSFRNSTFFATVVAGNSGVATFPQLQLNISGEYMFVVSSSITNTLITWVSVLPGPLAMLSFKTAPKFAVSEQPISIVEVALLDSVGNTVTSSQFVTLKLMDQPFNSLLGVLTVASLNGTALFLDLRINNARPDHRFVAKCLNLSAHSHAFEVKPGRAFLLRVAETVPTVSVTKYTTAGFLQSDLFKLRVELLDHFGNFIPDANITMSSYKVEQISTLGSRWNYTSSNGSAMFQLILTDEQRYTNPLQTLVVQYVFAYQNVSVTSNPIVALIRLNCRLTFAEQYIKIKFNSILDGTLKHISSCSEVLSTTTLSKLGLEPVCSFVSSTQFHIQYGGKTSMVPSDTVTFLPAFDVQAFASNLSAFNYTLEYFIMVPSNIQTILPIVRGSEYFGSCAPLILDGSASLNSFGRPFTFISWNLSLEHSTLDGNVTNSSQFEIKINVMKNIQAVSGLNLIIQTWKLPNGSNFEVPAGTYIVLLTLGRWIDAVKVTTLTTLRVNALASPTLLLSGPTKVAVSSEASFKSTIFRCSTQQQIVYLWSIKPSISATTMKTDGSTLSIPAMSLAPGTTYNVVCVASIQSSNVISSLNFTTELRPPEVLIVGGASRSFPVDENIILDGSNSIDIDTPSELLSFLWLCLPSTGNCPDPSGGLFNSVIQYPRNSFSQSQVVVFKLTATTTRGLSASSQITLEFIAEKLPLISIEAISGKVDTSNVVKLQGFSVGTIPSAWSIRWIDIYQQNTIRENDLIGGSQNIALIFKPNTLPLGRSLRFRVEVSSLSREIVFAEIEFLTNTPPTIGNLLISKVGDNACGVATLFNAIAENFDDFDTPLTYTFSYMTNMNAVTFSAVSQRYTTLLLPCSQIVDVFVSVSDRYGASSQSNRTIRPDPGTNPTDSTEGMADTFLGFLSGKPDPDEVAAAAGAVLSSIPTSLRSNIGALKDTILSTLASSLTNNPSTRPLSVINTVVGALSMVALNGSELSSSASSQIISTLGTVLGSKTSSKDPKLLFTIAKISTNVLNSLLDSPLLVSRNQRRVLLSMESFADMMTSTIERTCFLFGSSLTTGQGQAMILTSKLNLYANNIPLVSQGVISSHIDYETSRNFLNRASITLSTNSSETSAIFYLVTMAKSIFAVDYEVIGLPVAVGFLSSVLGSKMDIQHQSTRVFLKKEKPTTFTHETHRTICALKIAGSKIWSGIGCEKKTESDTLVECSCNDLGFVIAMSLPLDCEGLPYGRIDGYKLNPAICLDELNNSAFWLKDSIWGLVAVFLGILAAIFFWALYSKKKKRLELLKPLEMSSDNIADLLWNPTNSAVLLPGSADGSQQKVALSAPKIPQPVHLQAIRTHKAMYLQSVQSAANSRSAPEETDAPQHMSFSDSDGGDSQYFEDQTLTGFDSEYGSNTNTMYSSSAFDPALGDGTFFSADVHATFTHEAMYLQSVQSAANSRSAPEETDAPQHMSFSDSDGGDSQYFEDQTLTGFDSEYGSNTNTMYSSSAIDPALGDGMDF